MNAIRRSILFWVMLAATLLAATLFAPAAALAQSAAVRPLPRDSIYHLPAVLIDQHGKAVDWRAHRGRPQMVAMFYTSCRYICPLIVDSAKGIEHALTPTERARLGILLISMDPARDTPAALKSVFDKRKLDAARWSLASPQPGDVRAIAGALGIRYRALADGEFNHSSALVLLDAEGRIVARTERMGARPDPEFLATVKRALAR